jgi:hypothetical protein
MEPLRIIGIGDCQGAIGDLQNAINLYLEQGDMANYHKVLSQIQKLRELEIARY